MVIKIMLVILWRDVVIMTVILVILCCNGVIVTVIFLYITAIVGNSGSFDQITSVQKSLLNHEGHNGSLCYKCKEEIKTVPLV